MHPYNDPDADVCIRTSDGVSYRLYKVMLAKASPIFKDIFRLPTSQNIPAESKPNDSSTDVDELPIIDISENSDTLETLLRFIYPGVHPSTMDCGTLEARTALIEASRKYEMFELMDFFKEALFSQWNSEPLRVFCIAVHFGFLDEALVEAKRCLAYSMRPLPPVPSEIGLISSSTLYRLLQYLERCRQTAIDTTSDLSNVMKDIPNPIRRQTSDWGSLTISHWTWMRECKCDRGTVCVMEQSKKGPRQRFPARWWTDYMQQATAALENEPLGMNVNKHTIQLPALRTAGSCPTCGPVVVDQLTEFSDRLALMIKDAVDKVELDLGL